MRLPVTVSNAAARTPARGSVVSRSVIRPLIAKFTVTLNVPVAVLPDVSVAVQVTVVSPYANGGPDRGSQTIERAATLSPALTLQSSGAVGDPADAVTV